MAADERPSFILQCPVRATSAAVDWRPSPWVPTMSHRTASLRTGERAALLATEEAGALATALAIAPHDPTGVHEARKSLRRLRSLLALARAALGKDAVDAIDDELRAMTRDLSALRDGQVVQDMAHLLAQEATNPGEREAWHALLPALARRHEQALASALREDPGFMRRQALAHRQAERLLHLPWQRLKAGDLRHALARSQRRQARAQAQALASGRVDDLHDWRRKSRRLRMQLSALRKLRVAPHPKGAQLPSQYITQLVDQLGVLQDLALLHSALEALEPVHARPHRAAMRTRSASPIHPLA